MRCIFQFELGICLLRWFMFIHMHLNCAIIKMKICLFFDCQFRSMIILHCTDIVVIRPTSDHICQRCRCNSKMAFHHTNLRYLESNFTGKNVMKCRSSRDKSPTKAIKCKWQEQEPEKREKKILNPHCMGSKKLKRNKLHVIWLRVSCEYFFEKKIINKTYV